MRASCVRILIGVTAVAFGSLPATPAFAGTATPVEDSQAAPAGGDETGGAVQYDPDGDPDRDRDWNSDDDRDDEWYRDDDSVDDRDRGSGDDDCPDSGEEESADDGDHWHDGDHWQDEDNWQDWDDTYGWADKDDWDDPSGKADDTRDSAAVEPAAVAAMPSTPAHELPAGASGAPADPAAEAVVPAEPAPVAPEAVTKPQPEPATPEYFSELSGASHSVKLTTGTRPADAAGVLALLGALGVFGAAAGGRFTQPDASAQFRRDVKRALRVRRPTS